MHLPESVRQRLCDEIERVRLAELTRAAEQISESYRRGDSTLLSNSLDCLAYAAVRMPATYGAIRKVLEQLPAGWEPETVLDLGSGTGAGWWAVSDVFRQKCRMAVWERSRGLVELAQRLGADFEVAGADLVSFRQSRRYDLVIASYSLGELGAAGDGVVERAWASTGGALVLIEPGTPAGFERIRRWREQLVRQGCHLFAPCPQAGACPVVGPDWCHFAARVERSAWHRRIKGGTLSYEDEKFSYLVAMREEKTNVGSRVVRHPHYAPGLVELKLCTPAGSLRTERITRRGDYKRARKVEWGDLWVTSPPAESASPPRTEPE